MNAKFTLKSYDPYWYLLFVHQPDIITYNERFLQGIA